MRTCIKIQLLLLLPVFGMAQQRHLDSLRSALHKSADDSVRYVLYMQIGYYYQELERDSAIRYYDYALADARKHHMKYAEAGALGIKGYQFAIKGRYAESLQLLSDALSITNESGNEDNSWFFSPSGLKPQNNKWYTLARLQLLYSVLMHVTKNAGQEIFYLKESIKNSKRVDDPYRIGIAEQNLGNEYRIIDKPDSALIEYNDALTFLQRSNDRKYIGAALTGIGETYLETGNMSLARKYLFAGMQSSINNDNLDNLDRSYYSLTNYYLTRHDKDSSLLFAKKTLQSLLLLPTGDRDYNLDDVYENISRGYRLAGQPDSVNKYETLALTAKDSIYQARIQSLAGFQNLGFRQQLHLRDLEKQKLAYQSMVRIFSFAGAALAFLIIGFILWRNNKKQKHTNVLLSEQKEEIEAQRDQLEDKNQELEIESALERVRTVAMAMRTPNDLLDICKVLFLELTALGFSELRNAVINIANDEKGSFLNYDFNGENTSITQFSHNSHLVIERQVAITRSAADAFIEHVLTGAELEDFKAFRVKNGEAPDPRLENITALYYYFYAISDGSVGISAFSPLSEEKREVLKRFRNVFDLAYRRYLDIEKAEAQARESQIQLALERVRARTMAMQKSEELADCASLMFEQVQSLGIPSWSCGYNVWSKGARTATCWMSNKGQLQPPFEVPLTEHATFIKFRESRENGEDFWLEELGGKELKAHYKYITSLPDIEKVTSLNEQRGINLPDFQINHIANFSHGNLLFITYEQVPEAKEIFTRFAKVFDQTYTRFLDLQKAEEQAREARIENALEKVRSRSLAMHSSSELAEVAKTIFEQVKALGIETYTSGFNIWDDAHKKVHSWMSNPTGNINPVFEMPISSYEQHRRIYAAWKDKKEFIEDDLIGAALRRHYKFLRSFPQLDESFRRSEDAGIKTPKRQVHNNAFFKHGYLLFITEEPCPYQHDVFKRFARVFDQTYTRFLDLQKAETQAREAQIQLAMERVRARTMAMQRSEELSETAALLFKQISDLGIPAWTTAFCIWEDDDTWFTSYNSTPEGGIGQPLRLPATENVFFKTIYDAKKRGEDFLAFESEGESLAETYRYMKNLPLVGDHMRALEEAGFELPKHQATYCGFFPQGHLMFITFEPLPEASDIFKRFTKVFEQTYTRFLDLQKAEAQARESQIQLTLERIRARTMAMQRSDELADISLELFKQVQLLGIATWHCAFNIYDDDQESGTEWSTNIGGVYPMYRTPRVGIFRKYYEIGAAGEALHVEVIGKDRCADHYAWLCTLPGVGDQLLKLKASGIPFPTSQIDHVAYFKYGYLLFITYEPAPEAYEIFKRVAKTFEQTYTRFLDLQKAEAQARESQIQLALERVRARTMAMQHSEELAEVIQLVFDQLQQLNFDIDVANFALNYKETDDLDLLLAVPHGKYPMKIHVPYIQHPVFDRFNQAKKKEGLLTDMLSKEEKDSFFEHFFKYVPGVPEENKSSIFSRPGFVRSSVLMKNTALTIHNYNGIPYSEAENNTLLRFGQVFDQTYTRFSDLKQAEEQAREAQIQLALERVRARAMAMQNSDELAELVHTVFKELTKLDFALTRCIINILDANTYSARWWMANIEDDKTPASYFIKYKELSYFKSAFKAWKERNAKWEYILGKEEKSILDDYLFSETELKMLPAQVQAGMRRSESLVISAAYGNFGCLHVASLEPLSEENRDILARFGQVFDLTYTRFNDLKQAEAQARESQIQLALERVRARTMAMQKSEELAEAVFILFQQFRELGENPDQATIGIINEQEHVIEYWVTMHGNQNNKLYKFSIDEPNVTRQIYDTWKKRKKSLVIDLSGKPLQDFMRYRESMGGAPVNKKEKRRVINVAFFSKGLLNVQSNVERSAESIKLLERFAGVFEGTYTRFLDLKQVEAQAREGQIQLGLERVRAQAMAMQTSEELNELIGTVFTELTKLDFVLTRCLIMIFDPGTKASRWWMANSEAPAEPMNYLVQFHKHPAYDAYLKAWKRRDLKWNYALKGKVKRDWDDFLFVDTELAELPGPVIEGMKAPDWVLLSASFNNFGCLTLVSLEPLSAEHSDIMLRFAKVFDMSYTRFNDLKQAEEQAREAQIQLALERVRARTMAMQQSDELADISHELFKQVQSLGIAVWHCAFRIYNEDEGTVTEWSTNVGGVYPRYQIPNEGIFRKYHDAGMAGETLHIEVIGEDRCADHYAWLCTLPEVGKRLLALKASGVSFPTAQIDHVAYFKYGYLIFITYEPAPRAHDIFKRFAAVFEQTYTRFLDLQKAEDQAQEGQIQLALERVRARTMAMQKSDELQEVIRVVFEQLRQLNFNIDTANFALDYQETDDLNLWIATAGTQYVTKIYIPYFKHPAFDRYKKEKGKGGLYTDTLSFEEKNNFFKHFFKYSTEVADERKKLIFDQPGFARSIVFMKNTALSIVNYKGIPFSEAENNTLLRFGQVFDETYTRFKDLEQAEAQAREGQIQLGLERVRAAAMAMHDSKDVGDATALVFSELYKLGIITSRCGVCIVDGLAGQMEVWSATSSLDGNVNRGAGKIDMNGHPLWLHLLDAWKQKISSFSYELKGKELIDYYKAIKNAPNYEAPQDILVGKPLDNNQYCNCYIFNEGCLFTFTQAPFSPEISQVLEKFAAVFGLTYRRYLDLTKAEAQAREAQIEASLERVRGKAMAMRNSGDLSAAASTVFIELRNLGINPIRSGVGLLSKDTHNAKIYSDTSLQKDTDLSLIGEVDLSLHPTFQQQYQSWLKQENYFVELGGKELASYYKIVSVGLNADLETTIKKDQKQFGHWFMFSEGFLYAWSDTKYNESEIRILERFKNVIALTFRRYVELQQSEASAKEAIKQASLDRVRAEIASMRKRSDLERITPLIWDELTILGIPFIRCGVFIMDEGKKLIHTFLSTPDGKAIGAFHVPFDTSENFKKMVNSWRHKEPYIDHWKEEAFSQFADMLVKQGAISSKAQYMKTLPHEGVHLNFLPFLQGMLYVGNSEPLALDNIELIQAVAEAFSTAYARYEDFNKLEAAKQQVDNTLTQLKATQNKLIQSEKMASLGELTAGIAHEIQNPLNFVNNFSEVSAELIDEMDEELDKGDIEEAKAIANDLKENLQKIRHHGGRADGIVKGMLQHSRASSDVKEPTDINKLADEYLHLAYHGLRAKDKSFNAELTTHFDEKLPKVNVVPQDIGRVILNMINNAFYATQQKAKANSNAYRPEVVVTTCIKDGQVVIKVKDNGNGIPDAIKDKIMQPFFTTKPTGEGTGLGLSLSYDIVVKGHGGKIDMDSKIGEYTEFIVSLPLS